MPRCMYHPKTSDGIPRGDAIFLFYRGLEEVIPLVKSLAVRIFVEPDLLQDERRG